MKDLNLFLKALGDNMVEILLYSLALPIIILAIMALPIVVPILIFILIFKSLVVWMNKPQ